MTSRILFALAMTLPMTACLDSGPEDELDVDDAAVGDAAKADAAGGTYTYYLVQWDNKRCLVASPSCGGYYYRLANATKTTCLDNKKADKCYAAAEDFTATGLNETMVQKVIENQGPHEVLMRATIGSKKYGKAGTFAHINVKEAWLAQGPGPAAGAGPLMKIEDSGVRCITYPCPSLRDKRLNSSVSATIADLQWDRSGANDRLISQALDKMHTDGLIVSGDRTSVTGPGGEGKARSVTQLWLKATNEAPQQCFVGGCSGQVCSDEEGVITTCEYRPEYACYQAATCEVQDDGHCGWTQTEELQSCLAQN